MALGTKSGKIFVGVGGWTYAPWRGVFYPDGLPQRSELAYAASHLTSIEINGTFYGTQKPESFERWRDETAEDFTFSLKGPRYATNRRVLSEAGDSISRFFHSGVTALGAKLGPILWQLPPTKKFDAADFSAFLALLPETADGIEIRHAVEVRHASFACMEALKIASAHNVAIVQAVDSTFPEISEFTSSFSYIRIMGSRQRPKQGYGNAELDLWAERLRALSRGKMPDGLSSLLPKRRSKSRDVFCYFISGYKQNNPAAAQALLKRIV